MVQELDVLAVCCYLKDYNISISPDNEWLQQCIAYFKTENPRCSQTELQEFVCQQWLLADLRVIQSRCFPPNCGEDEMLTLLTGKYSVQVNWVRDIGKSSYSQLRNIKDDQSRHNEIDIEEPEEPPEEKNFQPVAAQMLMLEMTDGITTLKGMEYRPIKKFTVPILPGTKMIITGPVECRRGVLLLQEENITILGGEVDSLLDVNSPINVLARSLNLVENSDGSAPVSAVSVGPPSPVNNRQRNAVPLHSRHTAVAPPTNRYRDTTPLSPPTALVNHDEEIVNAADFDDNFDEDDELLLQVPEEVLNATADEVQTAQTQSTQNGSDEQQSSLSNVAEENEEVVYSENESDEEIFLDNPMISQQIRRSLSSQFVRSNVKIQPTVNTTQRPSVVSQNNTNRQNINAPKQLHVKKQIPVNNRLSTPLSNSFDKLPTNSSYRLSMPGTSFQSSSQRSSPFQSSTPGTSFQNSSSLFNNSNEFKKPSLFSKSESEKAKTIASYSETVERNSSFDDNIVNDIDVIETDAVDTNSQVTEEIFGSVQKLSSKLRIVQSEWVLTACISDGNRMFDVKFASQVVDEVIGFSAAELEARRFETANNPAVKEKVNAMLQNGQKELSTLCCAMLLEHSRNGDMPTVIKIMK